MMIMMISSFLLITVACLGVDGHGRLVDPPGRSSMWRFGFNTPVNYNDNQLFCGGFGNLQKNNGKCGLCGDPYDGPRDNEPGGIYATNITSKTYTMGADIYLAVEVTANHKGYFQFRLCENNDFSKNITQECLQKHILQEKYSKNTSIYLNSDNVGYYSYTVELPEDLTCSQCVLQWRYHTGNSWGTDSNGTSCLGCGLQEEFYACSDIAIVSKTAQSTASLATVKHLNENSTAMTTTPYKLLTTLLFSRKRKTGHFSTTSEISNTQYSTITSQPTSINNHRHKLTINHKSTHPFVSTKFTGTFQSTISHETTPLSSTARTKITHQSATKQDKLTSQFSIHQKVTPLPSTPRHSARQSTILQVVTSQSISNQQETTLSPTTKLKSVTPPSTTQKEAVPIITDNKQRDSTFLPFTQQHETTLHSAIQLEVTSPSTEQEASPTTTTQQHDSKTTSNQHQNVTSPSSIQKHDTTPEDSKQQHKTPLASTTQHKIATLSTITQEAIPTSKTTQRKGNPPSKTTQQEATSPSTTAQQEYIPPNITTQQEATPPSKKVQKEATHSPTTTQQEVTPSYSSEQKSTPPTSRSITQQRVTIPFSTQQQQQKHMSSFSTQQHFTTLPSTKSATYNSQSTSAPITDKITTTTEQSNLYSTQKQAKKNQCQGVEPYGSQINDWCNTNCNWTPPFCPASHCKCS